MIQVLWWPGFHCSEFFKNGLVHLYIKSGQLFSFFNFWKVLVRFVRPLIPLFRTLYTFLPVGGRFLRVTSRVTPAPANLLEANMSFIPHPHVNGSGDEIQLYLFLVSPENLFDCKVNAQIEDNYHSLSMVSKFLEVFRCYIWICNIIYNIKS